jgi:hypothetical protein
MGMLRFADLQTRRSCTWSLRINAMTLPGAANAPSIRPSYSHESGAQGLARLCSVVYLQHTDKCGGLVRSRQRVGNKAVIFPLIGSTGPCEALFPSLRAHLALSPHDHSLTLLLTVLWAVAAAARGTAARHATSRRGP